PLALIIAAAEAGVIGWSVGTRQYRPGLVVAARRAYLLAAHRRGGMATPGGGCGGPVLDTRRRAEVWWRGGRGGGPLPRPGAARGDAAGVTGPALARATAAIQHGKTVIIIDLTGGAASGHEYGIAGDGHAVTEAVMAACDGVHAPLAVFGAGRGHYEPFSDASPDRAVALVAAMIDWSGAGQEQRMLSGDPLRTAFEHLAAPGPTPPGHAG